MMKNNILLMLCLVSFAASAQNQATMYGGVPRPDNSQPVEPGSGLVHVDMYTGTGSVNVPIYEYSLDGLNLGVSLSYNAKGIRVDQQASSVGLGWSLNAGGSITRQKKGLEDEITTPVKFASDSTDHLEGYLVPGANYSSHYAFDPRVDDQEHDLYHINLCGRMLTLQFYLDNNDNLRYTTYPKSEIRLEFSIKDMIAPTGDVMTYGFTGTHSGSVSNPFNPIVEGIGLDDYDKVLTFNVIDEQGNKFYFERGNYEEKDYDYPNTAYLEHTRWGKYYPTNQWDLVKLVTATGFTVLYEYKKSGLIRTMMSVTETINGALDYKVDDDPDYHIVENPLTIKYNQWKGYKTHLSKIIYPNGVTVEFDAQHKEDFDTNGMPEDMSRCDCFADFRLGRIKVSSEFGSDMDNNFEYILQQAYFNSPKYGINDTEIPLYANCQPVGNSWAIPLFLHPEDTQTDHFALGYRLKLKKIEKVFNPSTVYAVPSETLYEFVYNTTPLPYRLSSQKDYYGFYNGNSTTPLIMANIAYANGFTSTNRQFDSFYLSIPKYVNKSFGSFSPIAAEFAGHASNGGLGAPTDYGTDRSHNKDLYGSLVTQQDKERRRW